MLKSKRQQSIAISKRDKQHLLRYLEYADPNHIQLPLRGVNWEVTHGEARPASKKTFHVSGRFVQDGNQTCILVKVRQGEYRRHEERGYRERGYGERGYAERGYMEKGYGERAESGHREREYTQISRTIYHIDPNTCKMYYINKYGRSQWA
jgi:hypothetical protein